MPKSISYYFLCFLFLGFGFQVRAQVNLSDSLALVDLYMQTKGDDWVDNSNWLTTPVNMWAGVQLTGDGTRVQGIFLPANNLDGHVPLSIMNLDNLNVFSVEQNSITAIPDLSALPFIMFVNVSFNQIDFGSLEPYFPGQPPSFDFQFIPQNPIGEKIDTLVLLGDSILIPNPIEGSVNNYMWFKDDGPFSGGFLMPDGSLLLDTTTLVSTGNYFCQVTNGNVPELELMTAGFCIQIIQLDSLGAPIFPRQLIVKFVQNITPLEKDTLRIEFGVDVVDSVQCRDIDLWGLPDSVFLMNGDTLLDIEEIKKKARAKSKVEEVDFNHVVEGVDHIDKKTNPAILLKEKFIGPLESTAPSAAIGDTVIVAVIDTGIDTLHPDLNPFIWKNPLEEYDGADGDDNCIIDDVNGFNFIDGTPYILDENGHGTHVAGIIKDQLTGGNHAELIGLRTHDSSGQGSIFAMISAVYYASSKGARVINISSGYSGEASAILPLAIIEAADSSQAVVVCSAGNRGVDNDTSSHYPSSFDLPNILSVASLNATFDSVAWFSNFGKESVDVATPGFEITSAVPGGGLTEKSGSSMAAAFASGLLVNVIIDEPELTAEQIVNCVRSSADFLPSTIGKLAGEGSMNTDSATLCLNSITDGFRMRAYLQGPFLSDSLGMDTTLFSLGHLPLFEPFTALGFLLTEGSGDTLSTNMTTPVEWGILELRSSSDSTQIIHQRPVLLKINGIVVTPEGDSVLTFNGLIPKSYYGLLRFRTHLDVMTNDTFEIDRTQKLVDFTVGTSVIHNPASMEIQPGGTTVIRCGDANLDNIIDAADRALTWNLRNDAGYLKADVNLDGVVDAADRALTWNNRNFSAGIPQ